MFTDCTSYEILLPQQNPPPKKRKQVADADDFQLEVGSPAKHSTPPKVSRVGSTEKDYDRVTKVRIYTGFKPLFGSVFPWISCYDC